MPNRVQWDPRHSVGNQTLDDQHQALLAQCNVLADCLADTGEDGDRKFRKVFDEIMTLAREHFATEEALLVSVGAGLAWGAHVLVRPRDLQARSATALRELEPNAASRVAEAAPAPGSAAEEAGKAAEKMKCGAQMMKKDDKGAASKDAAAGAGQPQDATAPGTQSTRPPAAQ